VLLSLTEMLTAAEILRTQYTQLVRNDSGTDGVHMVKEVSTRNTNAVG
jgi:hypothetical protein